MSANLCLLKWRNKKKLVPCYSLHQDERNNFHVLLILQRISPMKPDHNVMYVAMQEFEKFSCKIKPTLITEPLKTFFIRVITAIISRILQPICWIST